MRCRRICRELLWLVRFGEFGPSSAPHLDHLAQCGHCRDEIGFDRALVQQLRTALAERIANEEPSPGLWGIILERAQAPERGLGAFVRRQAATLSGRLRTATAVTAVALAGLIATSTHVAITHPEAGSAETEVLTSAAGEQFERQPLVPRPRHTTVPVIYVPTSAPRDPEDAFLVSASMTGAAAAATEPEADGASIEAAVTIGVPVIRVTPADPLEGGAAPSADLEPVAPDAAPDAGPY